jgi:hypothetical protein
MKYPDGTMENILIDETLDINNFVCKCRNKYRNKYKNKYLKYKNKYLMKKNI